MFDDTEKISRRSDSLNEKLHEVVFKEPLSETTKKVKRNLILISFIGLIIGSYPVKVKGFMGFYLNESIITDSVLNGMVSVVVLYLAISYCFNLVTDYFGWNWETERLKIDPYLDLLTEIYSRTSDLANSFSAVRRNIESIYFKCLPKTEDKTFEAVNLTSQEIVRFTDSHGQFMNDLLPKIMEEQHRIKNLSRVNLRVGIRFVGLLVLDIVIPFGLCGMALWKMLPDLTVFAEKIF